MALPAIAAPARADDSLFEVIRAADAAAAGIGYRLAVANAALCDRLEPGLGLVLHTPAQYAPALRRQAIEHFRLDGPAGVEAVIAGSPAARAGLAADDTITGAGPLRFAPSDPAAEATTGPLVKIAGGIAALPPGAPLALRGTRRGIAFVRTVEPVPACRTRFEVVIATELSAQADGEMVQVSSRFLEEFPDDQVAAVIAHELAHNILRHRERLEERGAAFGAMSGFGRNVRYFRQAELQADILSVSLLANAGYDPAAAARFWQAYGPRHSGGLLSSRSHPAWRDRLAAIKDEIALIAAQAAAGRPYRPPILDSRDSPLDGDWRGLLGTAR